MHPHVEATISVVISSICRGHWRDTVHNEIPCICTVTADKRTATNLGR